MIINSYSYIRSLDDGIITSILVVEDPNGNIGEPQIVYYKKENGTITLIGSSLESLSTVSFHNTIAVQTFPNPTNDSITVILPKEYLLIKIEVFNSLGQFIRDYETSTFSLQNYTNGTYYIKIVTSEGSVTKKIIKR